MWWYIGGGVYLFFMVLIWAACKAADKADRDMGLK